MEILSHCIGSPSHAVSRPRGERVVEVAFTKANIIIRMSPEEAVAFGQDLERAGKAAI